MKRKALVIVLASAMLMSMTACGSTSDTTSEGSADYTALNPIELIGADSAGEGAAGQLFGEMVAAKVDEITGGQLTINYHPNGDLGGDTELLSQAQSDEIQIVVCQPASVVSFVPEMAVFDLPMEFSGYDGDVIETVVNGDTEFRQTLDASYEEAGFELLGILQNGTYRLTTSDKALNTLEDFSGLKVRTMENDNHMAFWTAIGATPSPLAFSDMYIALQNETLDAQENAADTILGNGLNEVQEYLCCTNHILYANQICINKETWDSLDPLYQDALTQAVNEAIQEMRTELAQIDQENKDELVEDGMTLIEYDDSFFEEVQALDGVQALYADIDSQTNGLGTILSEELEAAAR